MLSNLSFSSAGSKFTVYENTRVTEIFLYQPTYTAMLKLMLIQASSNGRCADKLWFLIYYEGVLSHAIANRGPYLAAFRRTCQTRVRTMDPSGPDPSTPQCPLRDVAGVTVLSGFSTRQIIEFRTAILWNLLLTFFV